MCFYKGHYGFQNTDNIRVSRMFLKHSMHALTVKKMAKKYCNARPTTFFLFLKSLFLFRLMKYSVHMYLCDTAIK